MKIGILTYHRTHNYGGCLQALATRIILERMGHEVYYVDYWPDYHAEEYKVFNKHKYNNFTWKGKIRYILNILLTYSFRKKRYSNFEKYHQLFTYPFCKPLEETYDVIIYGSDQIWRKQNATKSYNPVYFGQNDFVADKHIAFSASMGILPSNHEDKFEIKEYVSHLDAIAVRELNLQEFLVNLGYSNVVKTIDPTLLLTAEEWDNILPTQRIIKEKYILIYALWDDVFNIDSIQEYARNNDLKIIYLRGEAVKRDTDLEYTTSGPQEFISLIKYAEMVFASSFHGLAFSLIYGRQVFVSFPTNVDRVKSLLHSIGLDDRYLENKMPIPQGCNNIDYLVVKAKIHEFADYSLLYLQTHIKTSMK